MSQNGSPGQAMGALLRLEDFSVMRSGTPRPLLDGVTFSLDRGETAVLLGEAGCGNDVLLRVLAGRLERGETASGSVQFAANLIAISTRNAFALPGAVYLPGPHAMPLSPNVTVLEQLVHVLGRRLGVPRASARAELSLALDRMHGAPAADGLAALPAMLPPEAIAFGLLAMSVAQTPQLVLADKLLAGLAPKAMRQLADALRAEQQRLGFALLYAAMAIEVAALLGGTTAILRQGRIIEEGTLERLTGPNAHAYTRMLFRDWREPDAPPRSAGRGEPVLQAFGLPQPPAREGGRSETLNFELRRGSALAFVGERGSGRHGLQRQIAALSRPQAGRILFDAVDTGILSSTMLLRLRRRIAYIAGDDDALDPRMTIGDTVSEPLRAHLSLPRDIVAGYREAALKRVGLASLPAARPVAGLSRFDKRRLQVARAIVTAPLLAVIDEPFEGLDAFAQSVLRDLLRTFRVEEGPAILVITADFAIARTLAESAFIFEAGRVVERGPIAEMLRNPKEPATRRLIAVSDAARGVEAGGLS